MQCKYQLCLKYLSYSSGRQTGTNEAIVNIRLVNIMGSHLKLRRHMRLLGLMRRTSLSPHRQILVLLDIQHQLQPISHPSLHGDQQWPSILSRVEGVAFSIAREDLEKL